jgi:hypothetical protein
MVSRLSRHLQQLRSQGRASFLDFKTPHNHVNEASGLFLICHFLWKDNSTA